MRKSIFFNLMMSGKRQGTFLLAQIPSHPLSYLTSFTIYWFHSQKLFETVLQTDTGSPNLPGCHSLICSLILRSVAEYLLCRPRQSSACSSHSPALPKHCQDAIMGGRHSLKTLIFLPFLLKLRSSRGWYSSSVKKNCIFCIFSMKNEVSQGTEMTYNFCSDLVSSPIPKRGERERGNIQVFGLLLLLLWKFQYLKVLNNTNMHKNCFHFPPTPIFLCLSTGT